MPEQRSCLLSFTCACTCVQWHGHPSHDQCHCELRITRGNDPLTQSAFMHTYHTCTNYVALALAPPLVKEGQYCNVGQSCDVMRVQHYQQYCE